MESGVRTPVEEEEAGGPEGSRKRAALGVKSAAGRKGATARCSEAHGCRSAGEGRNCEALVVRSHHRHSHKAGARTGGMAVGPGRQAGGCRRARWGGLKAAAAAGEGEASRRGSLAPAHPRCTDPFYTSVRDKTSAVRAGLTEKAQTGYKNFTKQPQSL